MRPGTDDPATSQDSIARGRAAPADVAPPQRIPLPTRHSIGYLLPEFPSQTHAFFWRELAALEMLGVDAQIISTRRPDAGERCHQWAAQASRRTIYLFPPGMRGLAAAGLMMRACPDGVGECLRAALGAGGRGCSRVRMMGLIAMGARLSGIAQRIGLGHIHVHSCADAAFIAMFSNMMGGPPYSLTLHGDADDYGAGQALKWGHAAFGFVVTSALLPGLHRAAPGLDDSKVLVAPMGVDIERFTRGRPYPPARRGPARVVCCGRLNRAKGQVELVRAAAALRSVGIEAEVRLIGDGPARALVEREIRRLALTGRALVLGALPESRVREELEGAHVFALPSHAEALGVATMEAMAMGVPVVVSAVGGVPELVRHGVDGLLVPARDEGALVEALREVLGNPAEARRMGESGAGRIREYFHSGVSASRLTAVLDTLYGSEPEPGLAARRG